MIDQDNYSRKLKTMGFEVVNTGGGNTAWQRTFANGNYVLITCDLGHKLEDTLYNEGCPIEVGAYSATGDAPFTDDYFEGDFGGLLEAIQRFCALAQLGDE